ncbi:SDR family oxidoreductase [Diaphorobacter caeni]|uniref:SDR family oxidoreductase n=1 Tax=Diaphorobacter caeni TaxID=2784387 RepID=UPI003898F07F
MTPAMADDKKTSRVALVTGAGSGIGKAAALALLADGWRVVLTGRREAPLKETALQSGVGERALAVTCDVTDPQSVRHAFDAAVNAFGRVDMLFNNAGIGAPAVPLEDLSIEQWKAVVDTNLNGMFYCIQNAFRVMKTQQPRGGRIINNGSISAHTPRPNSIAYTATKHAVMGLTKTASLDGRKYDIAVGQIDVGNAGTELAQRMTQGVMQAHGAVAEEPLMDVDIVGQSVLYMANLPLEANVMFHTVMATKMPFAGRG